MADSFHVLVLESGKDPEVERALRQPGFDIRFTREMDEALKLTSSLLPSVIILDMLVTGQESWHLIAEIWETAKERAYSPTIILLAALHDKWHVDHFGPVRFSDRRHLREVFLGALRAGAKHAPGSDPREETSGERTRDHMWAQGNQRFGAEQNRMRQLGILDAGGRATSKEWPADMEPGSTTDVAT